MKVLFLQRDSFPKMGIASLSAVLKKNAHQCDLLVQNLERDIFKKAVTLKPDIVAFSITTSEYLWLKEIGKKMRDKLGVPMICGGAHPTFYPEIINEDYLDIICMGEGEGAIIDLVTALQTSSDITKIRNLVVKKDKRIYKNEVRALIDDLDSLPFPDRTIYDKYNFFKYQKDRYMLTSRGCPFKCTFCFNKLYNTMYKDKGKIIRRRSVSEVIKEIKELKKSNANLKHLFFLDDTFILSESWVYDFLKAYRREVNMPFSCTARANLITEELVKQMKNAGCFSIRIGLESADDYTRNAILQKNITAEEIINASSMIKKYGIRLLLYNMLGTPGETLDLGLKTFELNRKIHPTYAWCSLLQPYPGTEIYEYALRGGYVKRDHNFGDMENSYFISTPIKMDNKKEMLSLQKIFSLSVFLRLPTKLVRFLIKLPLSRLYEMIFKVNYAIGISKVNSINMVQLVKTAIFSKDYFKKK